MDAPSKSVERMAAYGGSVEQVLSLVRTVAAMANSGGGSIEIDREHAGLDACAVTDAFSEYVSPPLAGIEVTRTDGGAVVCVPDSPTKPHVFRKDGDLDGAPPGTASLFCAGQVWVRRDGVIAPALAEDIQKMIREAASQFLERLSIGVRDPSFALRLTESAGVAVHLAEDEESIPVSPNLARLYPFTTKTLARRLGRSTNWVATAVKVLRLKERRENAYGVPAPSGRRVVQWRYSEHALGTLERKLREEPGWDPYHLR